MECLVPGGCAEQARGSAYRAESEIYFLHPSAGDGEKPQKNCGDKNEDATKNPGAWGHRGQDPDAGGGLRGHHLPNGNKQENNGVHQRHNGAFTIGENRESAHTW